VVQVLVARSISRWGIALVLIVAFLASSLAPAGAAGGVTGTLRGTVVDQQTGKPVVGAVVSVASPSGAFHATTDAHGFFAFLQIPTDTYVLAVEKQGYSSLSLSGVTVLGDQSQSVGALQLSSALRTIGVVHVNSHSASAFQPNQTEDETTFSGSRVDQALGEKGSTNFQNLVLAAPGVIKTSQGANSPISIRGSASDDIGYSFDGIDFRGAFFDEDPSQNFLNGVGDGHGSLEVVSGAGDATQGGVGAGVVNVVPGRGTYPGDGFVSADVSGPYYDHSLALQYGAATQSGNLSEFFSLRSDRYAPQIAPYGRSAASTYLSSYYNDPSDNPGQVFDGTSFTYADDVINNAFYRFGKDDDQQLQVLVRWMSQEDWAQYGGLSNASYYPYNPSSYATFQSDDNGNPMWACLQPSVCMSDPAAIPAQQLAWYDSIIPYYGNTPKVNTLTSSPQELTQPEEYIYGQENVLKLGYTRSLGPTAALNAMFYNWGGLIPNNITGNSSSLTDGENPPGYNNAGGRTVGFQLALTKQFGEKHTLTVVAKLENVHPYWDQLTYFNTWQGLVAGRSQDETNAGLLDLGSGVAVPTNDPQIEDWYLPEYPGQPVSSSNPCIGPARDNGFNPAAPTTMGCYLYSWLLANNKWTGTLPTLPSAGFDYGDTDFQQLGIGLRDQWSPTSKLKLDYGVRFDAQNLKWADNPFNADPSNTADIGFGFAQLPDSYLHPQVFQPRIALDYKVDSNNSLSASYGRSAQFFFGQTAGTPTSMTGIDPVLYDIPAKDELSDNVLGPACGSGWHGPGTNANGTYSQNPYVYWSGSGTYPNVPGGYYFTCPNYASSLYWAFDQAYAAPDIGGETVPTYNNWDFTWDHQFPNGWGTKLTSYWRRGYNTGQVTLLNAGPPDPVTGEQSNGAFEERETGVEKTFGEEFMVTTPDRAAGLSGFLTANYVNELTDTPPVAGSDNLPIVAQYLYQTGTLWHQSYLPPISFRSGIEFKTRSGWKINPIFYGDSGEPFGVGQTSIGYINGVLYTIPTGNLGVSTPYAGPGEPNQSYNATCYDDPAFAGSYFNPKYFACRGYNEPALAGQSFTRPRAFADLDLEYQHRHITYGVYITNLFDNYRSEPTVNQFWQPVATGQGGVQTGQIADGYSGIPDAQYLGGARDESALDQYWLPYNEDYIPGRTFRVYLQAEL